MRYARVDGLRHDGCHAIKECDQGEAMGLIHIDLFTTLDGVAQAPGARDEDTDGDFAFGGWQAPLFDDVVGEQVGAGMAGMDALLLGRKTYDIFAAYWPHQEAGIDAEIAKLFNRLPKYVASRGKPSLDWANSTLLGPDLVTAVREVRERHENVHVIGSLDLVQTLLNERLFDGLALWVFPVVLGQGKKVFADGVVPANLILTQPPVTSTKGAVLLRYGLGGGTPRTGDMTLENRGG
jgi:dihydrofolate reductase